MNDERERNDLKGTSDEELKAELEERMEEKWEQKGNELEKKIDTTMARLPRPVNALLDALCISLVIFAAAWTVTKLGWVTELPSWKLIATVFLTIFTLSMIYRFFIKSECKGCRR